MNRLVVLVCILLFAQLSVAQIRVGKLVIKQGEAFDFGQSDILVADTLIMMDSSRIVLNKLKRENFIRAKVLVVGNHCSIDGRGVNGQPGRDGRPGVTQSGPCRDGLPGRDGSAGLDGMPGINLFLYLEKATVTGQLTINLSGGNGGRGGNGGNGGGGSPGTLHCNGGNGANGGNAGKGGNGADGGILTFNSEKNPALRNLVGSKIIVRYAGGVAGLAGKAGYHGGAGLGPSKRNGKDGEPGGDNIGGISGTQGSITFE